MAHIAKGNAIVLSVNNKETRDIVLTMSDGWHVNSSEPIQDYLIPTKLNLEDQSKVKYPKGNLMKMGFSNENLSLYENTVFIKVNSKDISGSVLSLQACNDRLCLPPEKITMK